MTVVRSAALLEVKSLRTYFQTSRGTVRAVDDVSFTLESGNTIGIVGESGSGKTVLSRSVMRMLPKAGMIHDGAVLFEGNDITQYSNEQLRGIWGAKIGLVSQDPMTSLNPVVKIGRQITESIRHHLSIDKAQAKEMAISILKSVSMPEPERRFSAYPHELSGGLRQRVTIAIALACGPKLLIADEPTTALDVTVQAQILDLLSKLQRERNMGMILITHDLGVVADRCDEIAVMYAGKIVEKAPTKVLFSNMKMRYTQALIESIPRLSAPSHVPLRSIEGRPPDLVGTPAGCRFAPRCHFADERCRTQEPPLMRAESENHLFACWNPVGGMVPPPKEVISRLGITPIREDSILRSN